MKRAAVYLFLSIALIISWQLAGSHFTSVRLLISSPSLVVQYIIDNFDDLMVAFYSTFIESLIGLVIAIFFSFSLMIVCFYKPKLMNFLLPVLVTIQVVPLIVLAPFFIILFGIGMFSKIAMASLMCFFPIFINFAQGYKAINNNIHELMYIYNAPLKFRIREIYFPLSLHSIMAGLKVSVSLAVIGSIVAEFTGAVNGLGKNLFVSALRLEPELMMSSLILSTLLGLAFFQTIVVIERKTIKWI